MEKRARRRFDVENWKKFEIMKKVR